MKGADPVVDAVMETAFSSSVALIPWILVGSLKPWVVDMSVALAVFWMLLDRSVTGSPGCLENVRNAVPACL